ncbi:MAG: HAMP domain-containing histidine kinase [Bacteroidales bacterium]|nr:HAMP domain-containing histidine kinase [Bacteroidales bacterium]
MIANVYTEYAPAERVSKEVLLYQKNIFENDSNIQTIANSIPNLLLILNKERQIVFANINFIRLLNLADPMEVIGKRPGEAVNCIHSNGLGGCGTTQFCSKCGAVNAILESHSNKKSIKECRIMTMNSDALDFVVVANPYWIEDKMFTIFALSDISDEKRRIALERIFFHDVLNTAGGVLGIAEFLLLEEDVDMQKELLEDMKSASSTLIDEIKSQRQLSEAERGALTTEFSTVFVADIFKELALLYSKHPVIENKKIEIQLNENFEINTDKVLIKRVLGNMIKNALEATKTDGTIKLIAEKQNDKAILSVENDTFIPIDVQLQLFKRSYSTKGSGRGLGTYSIKLFGEKFLGGKVWFTTDESNGTSFKIELKL